MCKGTYSPKISEDLIPLLYKISKATGKPMTHTVNYILEAVLQKLDGNALFKDLHEEEQTVQAVAEQFVSYFRSSKRDRKKQLLKFLMAI